MSECEHHPGDAWQCATCLRAKVAELEARLAEAERLNIANVFGWTRYDAKLAEAEKRATASSKALARLRGYLGCSEDEEPCDTCKEADEALAEGKDA